MPTLPAPGTSALGPPAGVVLVAADDADMRLYLRVCLRVMGLGIVLEATGGGEALELARAVAPALVICDLVMPGLGGEGLCRALKADPRTVAIPLLLVSGETRAPPDGADGLLQKPFNAGELRSHVERLLVR